MIIRPQRWMAALLSLMLALLSFPARADNAPASEEAIIKESYRTAYDRLITVNGKTWVFYAQNNPVMGKAYSRYPDRLRVGDSSCAPTALANAIVNSVPYESIDTIAQLLRRPMRIDSGIVQQYREFATKPKFYPEATCDYFRLLPLVIINYAMKNNNSGITDYRSTQYYPYILDAYGIPYDRNEDVSVCLEEIRDNGAIVITCTGTRDSPISQTVGHFFLLLTVDDEYLYCMDSFVRDEYPLDQKHWIEILEPGLFRVKLEDAEKLCLTGSKFIIHPLVQNQYTEETYRQIIEESDRLAGI